MNPEQSPEDGGGLFDRLRRMVDSVLALAQNRLELFGVELQEEKVRFFELALRVGAIAVLGMLALMAATATVVVWLWNTSPGLVLAIITLLYGGAAALVWRDLRKRLHNEPPPFSDTARQFKKDRECLRRDD